MGQAHVVIRESQRRFGKVGGGDEVSTPRRERASVPFVFGMYVSCSSALGVRKAS